jgi:multidrug efflux pump subunit AcrB
VGVATLVACSMFYFKAVTVKLLPFDNKSEVQLVADLPEGTSLEMTSRVLEQAAAVARGARSRVDGSLCRHVRAVQLQRAGAALLPAQPARNGRPDGHASAQGRPLALKPRDRGGAAREARAIALPAGGSLKVVETPPGPPVLATLLAEIYGPDEATRQKTAKQVETIFRSVPYIVDVDNSFGARRPTLKLIPDRAKLDHYGLSERQLFDSIGALLGTGRRLCPARPITIRCPSSFRSINRNGHGRRHWRQPPSRRHRPGS